MKVSLSEGKVVGESKVDVRDVSQQLQEELYEVLTKIENELNGKNLATGEVIATGGISTYDNNGSKTFSIDSKGAATITGGIIENKYSWDSGLSDGISKIISEHFDKAIKSIRDENKIDGITINVNLNDSDLSNAESFANKMVDQIKKKGSTI